MCIQDNPRYIKLVEMGMPDTVPFFYVFFGGVHQVIVSYDNWWIEFSTRKGKPEDIFDLAFNSLERYYASHQ